MVYRAIQDGKRITVAGEVFTVCDASTEPRGWFCQDVETQERDVIITPAGTILEWQRWFGWQPTPHTLADVQPV